MIFKPFIYLKISHEQKFRWDIVYPFLVASTFTLFLCGLKLNIQFVGADGLLRQINGLLGVLAGFYIASLTAISALNSKSLSEEMAGDPPILKTRSNGSRIEIRLKRGEFLRYLFGYLACASLALFFIGIVLDIFFEPVLQEFDVIENNLRLLTVVVMFLYVFALSNIIINSLVGIYYLTDRMHRSEPEIEFKSMDKTEDGEAGELDFLDNS